MVSKWSDSWKLEDFSNAYRNWMVREMRAENYTILFDLLHDTEFTWCRTAPRDEDRAADGRYLRQRFSDDSGMHVWKSWLGKEWPCSFLEFLISLAYSIDDHFMYDPEKPEQATVWFWEMMDNIGLTRFDDDTMLRESTLAWGTVTETVSRVMARRYDYNGNGGLFPLKKPVMDQRKVEIWYQANAYMIENYIE